MFRTLVAAAAMSLAALLSAPGEASAAAARCGDGVRVSPGDTLARIAAYCDTTVGALLAANPLIRDPSRIYVGQVIRMPSGSARPPTYPPFEPPPVVRPPYQPPYQPPYRPPPAASRCGDGVRVGPGDTLARIAAYCGTTVGALLAANPQIRNPAYIYVGQVIRMPGRGGPVRPPYPGPGPGPGPFPPPDRDCGDEVRVAPGDTLVRIAIRCRVSVRDLLAANPWIRDPGRLLPGMRIRIPDGRPVPPPPGDERIRITGTVTREGVECTAVRGDDGRLYTLAGRTANLQPGDRVEVIGERAEVSTCMQGVTIAVERIRVL